MSIRVRDFIDSVDTTMLSELADRPPWDWTNSADAIIRALLSGCSGDYRVADGVAVHASAIIEPGAQIKPPVIVGADCFIAASALVRGGCWLDRNCIIGPHAELKSSFLFAGAKLAHLNFVGDSVLGEAVNIEAGAIVANYRNEREDKRIRIRIRINDASIDTGVDKFGALIGDDARIGANAVIAPGAILAPGAVVSRLGLIDQG
jgi:NDP-sugar pyrophosphorylase family protein